MKSINVLTNLDVSFEKFCWWSSWVDVAVFDYNSTPFLLQMRVSRFNKKKFNAIRMSGTFAYRQTDTDVIGDLVQMIGQPDTPSL